MFRYNKGEWSEIYAFTYLLSAGILKAADQDLNTLVDVYYPILRIIREEERGRKIDYFYGAQKIQIKREDTLLAEIDRDEFVRITDRLLETIPNGDRSFEIPEVETFLRSIFITKVKANSNEKEDITLQLRDFHTGIQPICGFSIKSFLGGRPTLVNPGTNTNFTFEVVNCNDTIMEEVNAIDTTRKIKDRIKAITDSGCSLRPIDHSISSTFEDNLCFIDFQMPLLLQTLLMISFNEGITSVKEAIDRLISINPLNIAQTEIYKYKFKKLLCAFALGMTPERNDWLGREDANGGYITVRSDGVVVCYHIYNRTEFEEYLLNYTVFDKPSTSRYHYMSIYKENGMYKLKLCLQIRFR